DVLDADLTVIEQLQKDFPKDSLGALRSLAGAFQFSGDDVDKKIRALSGGEKSRLAMARMLYDPPNFLVLDEPTNHLDLESSNALNISLQKYEGTVLLVTHDYDVIDEVATRIWHCEGGHVEDFRGPYEEYQAHVRAKAS
ncbi:MAG: ATP-binding cassette domain-containing protein, partial [Bryobacteraceae bacterium]